MLVGCITVIMRLSVVLGLLQGRANIKSAHTVRDGNLLSSCFDNLIHNHCCLDSFHPGSKWEGGYGERGGHEVTDDIRLELTYPD